MKKIPLSVLVNSQLPGFVTETGNSLLPKFLEYYYEYLESEDQYNNFTRDILKYFDSTQTTRSVLDFNFEEISSIPVSIAADKRKLAKNVYDIYRTKGTEDALKTLFRALYDVDVSVSYPAKNILKSSDGVWKQEVFVTIEAIGGQLPTEGAVVRIDFENERGIFSLTPTKISQDELYTDGSVKSYRVYFNSNDRMVVADDQLFYSYNSDSVRTFVGIIRKSPLKIVVLDGGKHWVKGSLFTIPGSRLDSVCRVTNTNSAGTITHVEILQHGMGHSINHSAVISPFPNKPSGSTYFFDKTLVSYNPTVYELHLSINDSTDGVNESVVGLTSHQDENSYFLEDFGDQSYTGRIEFVTQDTHSSVVTYETEDVSLQEWSESRATFVLEFGNVTRIKGYYDSERGKISNPSIRLQDNKYFQAYSYIVHIQEDIPEYKTAMNIVHPAGMKYFIEQNKSFEYDASSSISVIRNMSVDRLLLNDSIETFDVVSKVFTKVRADEQQSNDSISKRVDKYLTDSYETTMSDTTTADFVIYTGEDYFAETYTNDEIYVNIQ